MAPPSRRMTATGCINTREPVPSRYHRPYPALDLHRHPGGFSFPSTPGSANRLRRPSLFGRKAFVLFPGNNRKPVSGQIAE